MNYWENIKAGAESLFSTAENAIATLSQGFISLAETVTTAL